MGKQPAFQFYPGDWTRDLDDQDLEVEGAWIRIICRLWWSETRGEATKPLNEWARILRKSEKKTMKIFQNLLAKHIADGTLLDNQNITIISRRMKRMVEISKLRYEVGLKGGNPALLKTPKNLDNQTTNQNPRSSSSSSTSKNIPPLTPPKKRGGEYDQDFLIFWSTYPKKAKKPNAYREWKKLGSRRPDIAVLTACIQKQATWRPWIEGYIPDPERWLKNERWLDEPPPAGGNGNGGIRTARSDPRDKTLQSREDAEIAAIIAKRQAAKQSACRDTGGNANGHDAPDLPGVQLTG